MDRDLTCAEQTTRLPALPGWSLIGPPEMSCFQLHIMFPHLLRHLVQCPPTPHRYVEQTPGKFVGDTKCEKVRMLHSLRAKKHKFKSLSSDLKSAEIN